MYEQAESSRIVDEWLKDKINQTYIRIEEGWRGCDFQLQGWLKNN